MSDKELVFGLHAAKHVVDTTPERVLAAFLQDGREDARLDDVKRALEICGCHITVLTSQKLDRLAGGGRHQGVVLEVKQATALGENDLIRLISDAGSDALVLVLDGVQDPRNLGACLRVADGAGATAVVAPRNRAAGLTVSARKVASGAAVPFVQVTNLARCLRALKEQGVLIIGTSDQAEESLFESNLTGPVAVVLGAEQKGIRRLTRDTCDALISIPMSGPVSSLNVSVAAGVVLYEAVRQRR